MSGLEDGYRIYNTDPLKENAREGKTLFSNTFLLKKNLNF